MAKNTEVDKLTKEAWALAEVIMKVCDETDVPTVGTALTFAAAIFVAHNEVNEEGRGENDIERLLLGIDKMASHFIDRINEARAEGRDVQAEMEEVHRNLKKNRSQH